MMTWCIANARALWGQFRLGVQQPALYWHFRNKRALLDALASLSIARDARRALPINRGLKLTIVIKAQIRRLGAADVQDFREIRLSALKKAPEMFGSVYEHEEKKPMEAFAERLRDAVAFGAYIDGEIIGLSVFKQEDGPKDAHKAHLSGVFVEPEQRGRGVAGMLLRAVIDYGREHVEQIMLTVAEGNEAAINLYQRSARCPAPLQSPRRSAGRQSK